MIDGEPWFVGKDLCEALGYANHKKAMNDHCRGVTKRYPLQTAGGMQEVRVLAESDMLRLIVNSTLPSALRFEEWVGICSVQTPSGVQRRALRSHEARR